MQSQQNRLSLAVRLALSVGLASGVAGIHAQEATQSGGPASGSSSAAKKTEKTDAKPDADAAAKKPDASTLQAVEVTGSLIRRVDTETANPVVTLDRAALTNAGAPTLGNVLQALPSFSGYATNPQNNTNGGGVASPTMEAGDGASRLSLRGMGDSRTLMLVDGHRLANADLNMIPSNMIERVDVLADGASTVYGSDAIGGVANFILRKDFTGMEVSANDGISSHGDGQRHGIELTVGESGDRGNIVGGLDYNKFDPVLATARGFSTQQYYLYSNGPIAAGSHTIPTGAITLPSGSPLVSQFGCQKLTRASGDGTNLSDYRCFNNATDVFNYNAYNYIQTPQERANAFVLGNYKINDAVTYYVDFFYDHTSSAGQDAPEPAGTGSGWSVAANNPNNPFGVAFCSTVFAGCPSDSGTLGFRMTGAGTRLNSNSTTNITMITGLRGVFGSSSWTWDLDIDYGHADLNQKIYHEVNIAEMQAVIDAGGNPFDQSTLPVDVTDNPTYEKNTTSKEVAFNVSGNLFELPAGTVQLSAGTLYRKESMDYQVSSDTLLDLATQSCGITSCASPGSGSISVTEYFGEALFPLLNDAPFAKSLNLDVGVRTSDYDLFGTTTNGKLALEWKPVEDLLVRGTASQVFRAPNPDEMFDGPAQTSPTVTDPCIGQSAGYLSAHSNLCQYVPANWQPLSYGQVGGLYEGGAVAGANLKPEHGKSIDLGFVYSPSWAPGLSTTLDFWHITLNDLLTPMSAQTVLDICQANDASPDCALIHRMSGGPQPGSVFYIETPETNLGNLSTSGVDFNIAYALPHFDLGRIDPGDFKVTFQSTYTGTYKVSIPGSSSANYAGTYTQQFGNLARVRSTVTLNWKRDNWTAQWQTRYIDKFTLLNAYVDVPGNLPRASATYNSVMLGYTVPSIHTKFDFGIDNITDRTPPDIYQNALNYGVDTATYDTMGRYFWARATVKF